MEEFIGFIVMTVLLVLVPPYFLWFLGCMINGEWLAVNIFQWNEGARISMAAWTLIASIISFICFLETI